MARRYRSNAGAIVASVVGTLVAAALVFCVWFWWEPISGFFKDIGLLFQIAGEKVEQEKEKQESGFIFDDESSFQEGIFLTSVRIEEDDYAAYDVVETAESAYTIEATIEPANTTQTALQWTVEFVDASSTWANGKTVTDYVTVSPYGDNGAVVSCLQPFGAQIAVKVTLAENTALRASCICDYAAKILDLKNPAANLSNGSQLTLIDNVYDKKSDVEVVSLVGGTLTLSEAYTLSGTFERSLQVKFSADFRASLRSYSFMIDDYVKQADVYHDVVYYQFSKNIINWYDDTSFQDTVNTILAEVLNDYVGQSIGIIKYTITNGYDTYEKEFELIVDESWHIAATNVTLSDSNLTF